MKIPHDTTAIAPAAVAGLLLAARRFAGELGLPSPRAGDIIKATGATRSRAYEQKDALIELLPGLVRPVGRPQKAVVPRHESAEIRAELALEVVRFLAAHPGCMNRGERDNTYARIFKCFILELRERHADVDLNIFSECCAVPRGTLTDWLRPGAAKSAPMRPDQVETAEAPPPRQLTLARIEALLAAWRAWDGTFTCFCEHVRRDLRLDYGKSMIAGLLFEHGVRIPKRRRGRTPDEEALRGQFETFFGGAQWIGDGKALLATINGEEHHFNLELLVDAYSGAWVGLDVRDEEDSEGLTSAFKAGVQTTGAPPLAVLLDNKPSNHTEGVDEVLKDTMRIRATKERPQNKGHVEGAFGLFSQAIPPVDLSTRDPHELGRQVFKLVTWAFAVGLNRRPRRDRDRQARIDLYQKPVSDEERELAKKRLRARLHKQEQARRSRRARLDPALRALLDDAFASLGLDDPERHFRDAIALYRRDSIVAAIAIFQGKRDAGTLPKDVDARYLLGIVKNVQHVHEATHITDAILDARLAARDRFLDPLVRQREKMSADAPSVDLLLRVYVDALADAERYLDRRFWTLTLANTLSKQPSEKVPTLFRSVARRVHAIFQMDTRDRDFIMQTIARRLWPLD